MELLRTFECSMKDMMGHFEVGRWFHSGLFSENKKHFQTNWFFPDADRPNHFQICGPLWSKCSWDCEEHERSFPTLYEGNAMRPGEGDGEGNDGLQRFAVNIEIAVNLFSFKLFVAGWCSCAWRIFWRREKDWKRCCKFRQQLKQYFCLVTDQYPTNELM